MKTNRILFTVLVLVIFSVNSLFASVQDDDSKLRSAIRKAVEYPQFAKQEAFAGAVSIIFRLNSEGEVVIYSIECADKKMAAHVEKCLKNKKLSVNNDFFGKQYSIDIVFEYKEE